MIRLFYNLEDLQQAARQVDSCIILSENDPGTGKNWRRLQPQTLFMELRRADSLGVKEILVHCDVAVRRNLALMDRLIKASDFGHQDSGT